MLLRNSAYKGKTDYDLVKQIAKNAMGSDEEGYRKEFVNMVDNTMLLSGKPKEVVFIK